jgi:hypothetical protein
LAVLRGAFIIILAYTDWLDLSRRQTVIRGVWPWLEILNNLVAIGGDDRSLSVEC